MNLQNNGYASPSWHKIYQQTLAIMTKNLHNTMVNKTKLLGQIIFPIMISAIYVLTQYLCPGSALTYNTIPTCQYLIISIILNVLLKIYVGLIGTSVLRELVTLFMTQRNDQFRQYQMIMGVSYKTHTLANLLYMYIYMSIILTPFYLTLNYYHFDLAYIFYFAAFVISSTTLTLMFTAFFKDQKVALQIIGLFFSLTSFLPLIYDQSGSNTALNYFIQMMPNSSFTMAIILKDYKISLISFALSKFYILVFFIIQFRQIMIQKIQIICNKLRQYLPSRSPRNTVLIQELQLTDVVTSSPHTQNLHQNKKVIIKTQNLCKQYTVNSNKFFALNNLSISICQSQIFGLLGRNGAGKTTLVDILTKVTKPSSGTIDIGAINGIGICYQHEILYENLTVMQHLKIYSKIKTLQQGHHGINDVIQMLKIQDQVDKKVKDLSGGNKRKLSIAISILNRPQILIFDEPTSGLDPLSRTYIWDILLQLKKRKSTIILTTHHLDQAQKLSDSICVIQKGRLIVENTPQFIKQKYGKGFHFKIYRKNTQQNVSQRFDKYKHFLQTIKLKNIQIQSSLNYIHILIQSDNKNNTIFQQAFQKWIKMLQNDENIDFKFHSNTLQESFIAILKQQESNSGQSLSDGIDLNRHLNSIMQTGLSKFLCQIWGTIIKNYYFRKSTLFQSLILYNINILIVLIYYAFNKLLSQDIEKQMSKIDTNTVRPQKQSNTMMIIQGYIIMATVFITVPVYQTQKRIRSVLNTRGLYRSCYWIGNFLFDYTIFMINLLIMKYFIDGDSINKFGLLQLSWSGAAMIMYAYCISNIFSKAKTASTWFTVLNMLFGFIIMPIIIFRKYNSIVNQLEFIKYFYPFYNITLISFGNDPMVSATGLIDQYHHSTIIICFIIYIVILFIIETHPFQRIMIHCSSQVFSQQTNNTLELQSVTKKYGSTIALQNVNYSINQQRVALLGHNGAGKSTTFSLLTLQARQTQGAVYISKRIGKSYDRILSSAGICYQQDALWQQMTVQQIIKIFKWIVPIEHGQDQAAWLFKSLQFDPNNVFKRFRSLSGGNKRKLCLLIALFGNPQIRLLDECSTGLDPSSRVAMVSTIKCSKKGSTLFTTHSMSQAQHVCSKAVIMSKGRVVQYQNIDKLISKHFQCWWIDILLQAQQKQSLKSMIPQAFVDFCSITTLQRNIRIQIKKLVKQSQVYQWLCLAKQKGLIVSYSWIQPVLQDVYIKLTSEDLQHQNL